MICKMLSWTVKSFLVLRGVHRRNATPYLNPALSGGLAGLVGLPMNSVTNAQRRTYLFIYLFIYLCKMLTFKPVNAGNAGLPI